MRRQLFLAALALCISPSSWGADSGTYRPGQPYMSVPAQHPNQCAQQCAGDALCKGWNFVTVNKAINSAICEFNRRAASPIPSAISISGQNSSAWDSARIVPAGHRTTRIGQPVRKPVRAAGNTVRVGTVPTTRRIVKSPVPQRPMAQRPIQQQPISRQQYQRQTMTHQTAHRAPQQPQQMRFRHNLDAAQAQRPARPQFVQRPMQPRQIQRPFPTTPMQPAQIQPHDQRVEPPAVPTEVADASTAKPKFNHPPLTGMRPASEMTIIAPSNAVDSGLVGGPIMPRGPASLYGSLHDDVKTPKALTAADIPTDPDAPIPTVTSVPVAAIEQSNF